MSPGFAGIIVNILCFCFCISLIIAVFRIFTIRSPKPVLMVSLVILLSAGFIMKTDAYQQYEIAHPSEVEKMSSVEVDLSTPESAIESLFSSWNGIVKDMKKSHYIITTPYAWYEKGAISESFYQSIANIPGKKNGHQYYSKQNSKGYYYNYDDKMLCKAILKHISGYDYTYKINSCDDESCSATITFNYSDVDAALASAEQEYDEYENSIGHQLSAGAILNLSLKRGIFAPVKIFTKSEQRKLVHMFKDNLEENETSISFDLVLKKSEKGWRADSVNDSVAFIIDLSGNANIWPQ